MKKDITTKETIRAVAYDVARHILGLNVEKMTFVDKELTRIEKRESDLIAECEIDGVASMLHVEIQNDNDPLMHHRMLRYFSDIKVRYEERRVLQYVIYIGRKKMAMRHMIEDEGISYTYHLIDMHTIDCDSLLLLDRPEALVLGVLCDFKERDEKEVLAYIVRRLHELCEDDESRFGNYLLMAEILSENRMLKEELKEVEKMLREVSYKELPSYEIGLEAGMEAGKHQGELEAAAVMIRHYRLSTEEVARMLGLELSELHAYLSKQIKHD